jgi:murein endopeptidase
VKQKYFTSRVPKRSWTTQIAGISRGNFAGSLPPRQAEEWQIRRQKQRICGVPTLEKPTNEGVERQFETTGSRSN